MEMPVTPAPMTPANVYMPQPSGHKLFSKKNIILMFFLLVLVIALPVGVYLVQKTQIFKSKATAGISFITINPDDAGCVPTTGSGTTSLTCTPKKTGQINIGLSTPDGATWTIVSSSPTPVVTPTATIAPGTTVTPVPTVTPGATTSPAPTAAAPTEAPTPTASETIPDPPFGAIGYCTKNSNGTYKATYDWNARSSTHHYWIMINNTSINTNSNATSFIADPSDAGAIRWFVAACNSKDPQVQNQCSTWVKGQDFTCQ